MREGRPLYAFIIDWPDSGVFQAALKDGAIQAAVERRAPLLTIGIANFLYNEATGRNREYLLSFLASPGIDGYLAGSVSMSSLQGGAALVERMRSRLSGPILEIEDADHSGGEVEAPARGGAFAELLAHLFGVHGYRSFAYVSGPAYNRDAMDRLGAFKDFVSGAGLPCPEESIVFGDFGIFSGTMAVKELLDDRGLIPRAIVCANDQMAAGAMLELITRGIRVPEEIAVTGFDDALIDGLPYFPLTTVKQPIAERARRAFHALADEVEGKGRRAAEPIDHLFLARTTCGCPGDRDTTSLTESGLVRSVVRIEVNTLIEYALMNWSRAIVEARSCEGHPALVESLCALAGLDRLRLSLIDDPDGPVESRMTLVAGFEGGKALALPEGGLRYPALSLLPPGLSLEEGEDLVLTFITYEGRVFGLLYCSGGAKGDKAIELIRARLSIALHSLWMLTQLEGANERLRLEAAERRRAEAELKEALSRLEGLAVRDELTDTLNRRGFMEIGAQHLRFLERGGAKAFVLFCDLDGLDAINDAQGRAEGDRALAAAGAILKGSMRGSDIVARIGDDEFAVLAATEEEAGAENLGGRIMEAFAEFNAGSGKPYAVALSLGWAKAPRGELYPSLESLLREAEERLYLERDARRLRPAKSPGR